MAELDVQVDDELAMRVNELAVKHYGDDSQTSQARVVEVALYMRLFWEGLLGEGRTEVEEPIASWEFEGKRPAEQLSAEIIHQLFKRR